MNTNDIINSLEKLTPKQKRVAAALITTDGDLAAAAHIINYSVNTMYQHAKTLADKLLVTSDTQAVISFMNVMQFVNYVTRSKSVELPRDRLKFFLQIPCRTASRINAKLHIMKQRTANITCGSFAFWNETKCVL